MRLVFGAVAGVSDAYARARAEKMAVKITAMSVHTSRVDVVMPKARVDVRRPRHSLAAETVPMSGKALASDSEDDDVPTNASPAVKRETEDAGAAKPAAKKVARRAWTRKKAVTDAGWI